MKKKKRTYIVVFLILIRSLFLPKKMDITIESRDVTSAGHVIHRVASGHVILNEVTWRHFRLSMRSCDVTSGHVTHRVTSGHVILNEVIWRHRRPLIGWEPLSRSHDVTSGCLIRAYDVTSGGSRDPTEASDWLRALSRSVGHLECWLLIGWEPLSRSLPVTWSNGGLWLAACRLSKK